MVLFYYFVLIKTKDKTTLLFEKQEFQLHESSIQFKNLPFGEYNFKLRARVGNKILNNTVTYKFKIKRPWYLSNYAIIYYLFCLILFSFLMHTMKIKSHFFHGGISSEDKKSRLNDWLQGKITVMVATNAFGMGIDHPKVRYVFHLHAIAAPSLESLSALFS